MRLRLMISILVVLLGVGGLAFAAGKSIEVGNKFCPVSGEEVGVMGPPAQYEYNGKIYNFCCAGCLATFKEDPEKYVKIVDEQMKQSEERNKGDTSQGQEPSIAASGETASQVSNVKEIPFEAYQFGYSPERIVVKKGDTVKLLATSRDVPHGIAIKEYGINEKVKKGEITNIEFTADKAGEFDILCSVYCGGGHRQMKAKLVVEE